MLAYLDILIGLSVIMLGFSLIVTVVNQTIANVLATRGTNLRWGLSVLIQELHSEHFTPPTGGVPFFGKELNASANELVGKILSHRLLSDSKVPLGAWKLATAIRFDELLKTIDLIGASGGGDAAWLRQNNRITETWFNTIMDRVSQRFTMHMRIYSVVVATVVVLWTGMDTLHIVDVLRSDAALRSGLVSTADSISKNSSLNLQDQQALRNLTTSVVGQLPKDQSLKSLLSAGFNPGGMLLSVVLLSLGAPFWFNALKNLMNLRSTIAKKEESERTTSTTAGADVGDRITWRDAAHA